MWTEGENFVDIEFATTNELLKELLGRSTFQGIIVKARHEFTGIEGGFPEKIEFEVAASNIPPGNAAEILGGISASMAEAIGDDGVAEEWENLENGNFGFDDGNFEEDDDDDEY